MRRSLQIAAALYLCKTEPGSRVSAISMRRPPGFGLSWSLVSTMRILSLLLLPILVGCGGVVYEFNPKTGELVKKPGFSRVDDFIYYSIDSSLAEEARGQRPSGGRKDESWREFWRESILAWRKDNNRKYEDYLLRRRKELGLRDLNGP